MTLPKAGFFVLLICFVAEPVSEGNIAPLLPHGLWIVRAAGILISGWILIAYLWYLPKEKDVRWQEDPEVRSPPPRVEPAPVQAQLEPVAAEKPS